MEILADSMPQAASVFNGLLLGWTKSHYLTTVRPVFRLHDLLVGGFPPTTTWVLLPVSS